LSLIFNTIEPLML